MNGLRELENELARLGMKIEELLVNEQLDHKTGSTAEALTDISQRVEYCYVRIRDEIKALESWARIEGPQ